MASSTIVPPEGVSGVVRADDAADADDHADTTAPAAEVAGSCGRRSWAVALGMIISALMSSSPTTRIETHDRDRGEDRQERC